MSHNDWYMNTSHLLGKVQLKRQRETKCRSDPEILMNYVKLELDSEKVTDTNIYELIDSISL